MDRGNFHRIKQNFGKPEEKWLNSFFEVIIG
jgi:hypothetical protein